MGAYYGVAYSAPQRVLCHRITVEGYTRTVNGKTYTVNSYSRDGNEAEARAKQRSRTNEGYNKIAAGYASSARSNLGYAGRNAKAAYTSATSNRNLRTGVGLTGRAAGYVGKAAGNMGEYARTRAEQAAYNAKEIYKDVSEAMAIGIGNFMEEAKFAGSVIGDYCKAGFEWIKNLIGNIKTAVANAYGTAKKAAGEAYGTAKKVAGEAYGQASKAVSGAYNTAKETVTNAYNDLTKPKKKAPNRSSNFSQNSGYR